MKHRTVNPESKRRAALIGVGGYGGSHLEILRNLEQRGEVRLAAVADPCEDNLPVLSQQLRKAGVVWYRDYLKMLAGEKPLDLVVIATPIPWHEQMSLDALRSGAARILLEKPAVPSLSQLKRLMACDASNRIRVGFQTVHSPQVKRLREWIQGGVLGKISTVTAVAGWPRGNVYFSRSGWAGRMSYEGRLVFDGPATNALSHVLNNICYMMGEGSESLFGRPDSVRGWLARARRMESYDTFFSECRIAGAQVRALLTHAVEEQVPYEVKVVGDAGTAVLSQEEPFLRVSHRSVAEDFRGYERPEVEMYSKMLGSDVDFAAMAGKLADVWGYTEWTEQVRLSGPIRQFAPERCRETECGVVAVRGMEETLRSFLIGGEPPQPVAFQ